MKFNLQVVCFILLGIFSASFGGLDFHECGSDKMEIERIDMETCRETPCPVLRGRTYTIYVHPDKIRPPGDDINVSARALIRGASFAVNAYAIQPCSGSGSCFLGRGEPVLEIAVTVNQTLLRGPAPLIINATYLQKGVPKCRFCFEFDVNIY